VQNAVPQNVLEARGIVRDFPGVRALDHVDFETRSGEVHAVVGANGAGKSTLAKVIAGVYPPNEGQLLINGEVVSFSSPADAKQHGIMCAYQEVDTALVSYLSVTENVLINRLVQGRNPLLKWRELHRAAEELLERVDLHIDVRQPVSELSLHEKQKVVIAQALESQAKFLILDEPTAPLSLREVDQLFELINHLTKGGDLGIIYISHRMQEVFNIADRITVMRDGRRVATVRPEDSSTDEVVFLMLDKSLDQEYTRQIDDTSIGEVVFETQNLNRPPLVNDVSFQARAGEVVGFTGLVGAGKTELARVLFGADHPYTGRMILKGKPVSFGSPSHAVQAGMMLVPEERRQQGVLVEMPIAHNLSLPSLKRLSRFGIVQRRRENETATRMVNELGIVCRDIQQEVKYLSGGNQQKVAVGKWLVSTGQVFIFDEPTKGVDVGAKTEIFRLVGELAAAGACVLYFSSEIQEVLGICDRILVMYDGHIVAELDPAGATQDLILKYATGAGDHNGKP
jgi:simple sugar transport system ATP-binding protein